MKSVVRSGLSIVLLMTGLGAFEALFPQAGGDPLIRPRSVEGTGVYFNGLELLLDGVFAEEGGSREGRECLFWEDEGTSFVLDLGKAYSLTGVRLQADGNDDYRVEYSSEGDEYLPLVSFLEEFQGRDPGMATMSNVMGDDYRVEVPDPEPVTARYLRISASRGDGEYAVAEIQILGFEVETNEEPADEWDVILPSSVEGLGEFMHSADLIIDGRIPPEGDGPRGHSCVYWEDPEVSFVIDLGGLRNLAGLLLQIDGDDGYLVEYSSDGVDYIFLIEILPASGEVENGMDTVGALEGHPESLEELEFWPIEARFLRLTATGGASPFSVSEIQAFTRR